MNIDILEEDDRRIKFVIEDATPQLANALRRVMVAKIPTMAIEEVAFTNNTSGLFDEMIAHRLGMIPWEFDADAYNLPDECDCDGEGCPSCEVRMVLERQGDDVLASHLKPTDKDVQPKNPDIKIVELLGDQELELEAVARLGIGQTHAKFQAANTSYKHRPIVRVNGDEVDNPEEAAKVAPDRVKNADGAVEADEDIVYAMEETVDLEEGDEIELEERDDAFLFQIESVSGYSPRELARQAASIISEDLDEFEEASKEAINEL